jgi:uncharacterized protein YecE (DUF72 family)
MAVRVGTCAWADHERFYPRHVKPSERLAFYAQYFSVVEVDSTYYGIPQPRTVKQWVKQTPTDFVFDVKAYRTLTQHDRGAATPEQLARDFELFVAAVSVLADAGKLGILLFQFPPWFVCSELNRAYVEWVVEKMSAYTIGVEFRNRSWFTEEQREATIGWMRSMGTVNVVCDEPQVGTGTIPLVPDVTHPRYVVFRLHGRNAETWYQKGLTSSQQRFDYKYSRDELSELLPLVTEWASAVRDVHILMNNNQADYAVTNALDWLSLLGQPVKERPRLEESTQLSLFELD